MMVERIWPTCIGLATFGELKSMTTVFGWRHWHAEPLVVRCGRDLCRRRTRVSTGS